MKEPQRDLTGALFKEEKNPKIDYSGSCTIEGQEYFINAWIKESASGRKYMSLSFKAKLATTQAQPYIKPPSPAPQDDDIPF